MTLSNLALQELVWVNPPAADEQYGFPSLLRRTQRPRREPRSGRSPLPSRPQDLHPLASRRRRTSLPSERIGAGDVRPRDTCPTGVPPCPQRAPCEKPAPRRARIVWDPRSREPTRFPEEPEFRMEMRARESTIPGARMPRHAGRATPTVDSDRPRSVDFAHGHHRLPIPSTRIHVDGGRTRDLTRATPRRRRPRCRRARRGRSAS